MDRSDLLDVTGQEPEGEEDAAQISKMFIQYKTGILKVPANINEKNKHEKDANGSHHDNINHQDNNSHHGSSTNLNYPDVNMSYQDTDHRRSVVGQIDFQRNSSVRKKVECFEPTYRMEPEPDQYFVWYKVRNLLNRLIMPLFESYQYNSTTAGSFCKMISNKSMLLVKKKHDWPRYRYVCHVTLFEMRKQGVLVGERSLTYSGTDNRAVCLFTNEDATMIVTFHGLYYE